MSGTDNRTEPELPVTAEVGDEGGSFADPTLQVDTFSGVFGNPRVDQKAVAPAGAVAGAVAPDPDRPDEGATVTPATEPPDKAG